MSLNIAGTEVTVAQFKTFLEATGYKTDAEKYGGMFYYPCPDQSGYAQGRNWQDTDFDQTEDHPACFDMTTQGRTNPVTQKNPNP